MGEEECDMTEMEKREAGSKKAIIAVVVVVASHLRTPYCYIDGQPIYDKEEALAYTECLSRLEHLDRSMDIFDNLLKNNK